MTPKEKSEEIFKEFREILDSDFPRPADDPQYNFLAQCNAILCVENILKSRTVTEEGLILDYWKEVLSELTNM
jgi:hypothetical protein